MNLIEQFDELKAQLGIGSAVYVKDPVDGKFFIAFPAEEIPSFSGDTESVEINVTTSATKTKIAGKETLNDVEFEIFNHRDNKALCEKFEKEPQEWLIVDGDYSGERATGTMSWKTGSRNANDPSKITVKITPSKLISKNIENVKPLLKETAKIVTAIPTVVHLDKTTGTYVKDIALDPADATITVKSEVESVATATAAENKVTITGVKEGESLITITTNKDGCAFFCNNYLSNRS